MTLPRFRFHGSSPGWMLATLAVACSTGPRPAAAQATLSAADLRDDFALLTTAILEAPDRRRDPPAAAERRVHRDRDRSAAQRAVRILVLRVRGPSRLVPCDHRRPAGDSATLVVAAVPRPRFPSDTAMGGPPLRLGFLDDSAVALLRITTFAADEITAAGADYAGFLDSAFGRIRAARSADLILDLRGNDGGRDTYGSLLLRHLMRRRFGYYRALEARTDRVSFWPHTNVDSSFNARFGAGLIRTARGTFRLPQARHQNLGPQRPVPPVFAGRVWVLIDGGTFSTAAEFCAVARSLGRATFVGQETGGTYEGNTSGTFVILTLPRSGVRVVIPLVRYALAVEAAPHPGRGVLPDHAVPSAADSGDAALGEALRLIGRTRDR
jgi:C-terminal processing protease CtpA/Prc